MKQYLLILALLFAFSSCQNNQKKEVEPGDTTAGKVQKTKSITENFNDFYVKFHSDTAFQMTRIRFPIEGNCANYDTVMKWTPKNWGYIRGTVDEIDTTRYNLTFEKKPDVVFEGVYCKECGFSFEARFQRIEGLWYLTYRQDNNF